MEAYQIEEAVLEISQNKSQKDDFCSPCLITLDVDGTVASIFESIEVELGDSLDQVNNNTSLRLS